MSPREFELVCCGALWREERRRDAMAWVVGQLLAAWTETPPPLAKLLGGREPGTSRIPGYE